jgi:acyl-homoserine lactone acylase PvdQ
MMPESPFTTDKYPEYIYNDEQDRSNPRGRSALRLLAEANKMTEEQAKQIALNTRADGYQIWQKALKDAYTQHGKANDDLNDAVQLILDWNGHLDADQEAPALYRFWRRDCGKYIKDYTAIKNGDLSANNQKNILKSLKNAKTYLTEKFGQYKIPWGKAVRLKRGDKTWPISGGSFRNGVNALRAANGHLDLETGITSIDRGQSCTMVVILADPIRSFSILPFGQSDDPESKHFTDQAEALFSKSVFKSTYFNKDDLMKNLESTIELLVPDVID